MFKLNVAGWDRILRVVLGLALLYLGLAGIATGGLGVLSMIVGVVFLLTGAIGWCPLYALFHTGTRTSTHA